MTKEKTAWYPVSIKPHREGVYEVSTNQFFDYFYSFWDGEKWMATARSIQFARQVNWSSALMKNTSSKWRGLTSEQ